MNTNDPLDSLNSIENAEADGIRPVPDPIERDFSLVSQRSREDLEQFGGTRRSPSGSRLARNAPRFWMSTW